MRLLAGDPTESERDPTLFAAEPRSPSYRLAGSPLSESLGILEDCFACLGQ